MSTAVDVIEPLTLEEMEATGRRVAKFRADYEGTVYAVMSGDFIKIGFTKGDVLDRMAQLQTGSPIELRLLGFGPGGRFIERGIHDILKSFKAHGEWFRDEPIVRNTVRQFCTTRAWI